MAISGETVQELQEVFNRSVETVRKQKITGFRREDKSAWFSPQRDMINQVVHIISAAAAIGSLEMSEEDQEKLGSLPADLLVAAQGEQGGAMMIPSLITEAYNRNPELITEFMAMIGYAFLFNYSALPANYVNPEGLMESDIKTDTVLSAVFRNLCPDTRNRLLEDLEKQEDKSIVTAEFSEDMKQISEELSKLIPEPEEETESTDNGVE